MKTNQSGQQMISADDSPPRAPVLAKDPVPHLPEVFQIVVECDGEQQQRSLFERLRREGLKLRLLVL